MQVKGNIVRRNNFGPVASVGTMLLGSLLVATPVCADVFTVGSYPVEATAVNAVEAKKAALADGQSAAFRSLLKRLVPVTSYSRLEALKAFSAATVLDGVSVRSERNSGTDYIATLDFSFRADDVRSLLRSNGVPFVDEAAPESVLVPLIRETSSGAVRSDLNWKQTWTSLDLKNTLTPLRIEALKPVIHVDTITMALSGDGSAERILASEYQADRVVLLIAEPDKAAGKIHLTAVGRDATGPISWKHSYRLVDGDVDYTLELAAVVTLGVLEGRWKAAKVEVGGSGSGYSQASNVSIQAFFSSIDEWNAIRRRLLQTNNVEDVQIGSISPRSAEVWLKYPGGGVPLASILTAQGLSLQQVGQIWHLRAAY
jgi:Uncharacterized protein conserved in bacteria (DUF2066)